MTTKKTEKKVLAATKRIGRLIGKDELEKGPQEAATASPKTEAVRVPTVGRIVLFHGTSGEVIGPAIISRVTNPELSVVDLHAFEPDGGVHLRTGVQNTNIGGWTWLGRV
jgi:hypothetical protein